MYMMASAAEHAWNGLSRSMHAAPGRAAVAHLSLSAPRVDVTCRAPAEAEETREELLQHAPLHHAPHPPRIMPIPMLPCTRSGPREDATRIGSAGVVRRQAVDISPLRRVNQVNRDDAR